MSVKEYKECRDCSKGIGDTDLFLKGAFLYCADCYMERFGVSPYGYLVSE